MTDTRTHHFERLGTYRNSREYAEYAKQIGADIPPGDLPSLIEEPEHKAKLVVRLYADDVLIKEIHDDRIWVAVQNKTLEKKP